MSTELPEKYDGDLVQIGRGYEDLKELYDRVRDMDQFNEDPTAASYEDATEFVNAIKELVPGESDDVHLEEERSNQLEAQSLDSFEDEHGVFYLYNPEGAAEEYIQFF